MPKVKTDPLKFEFNTTQVAKFFEVTPRQVQRWVSNQGCPRKKPGVFDLKAVHQWWLTTIKNADEDELNDAKRLYWKAKATAEQLKVGKQKKQLYPRAEVAAAWASRVAAVRAGLLAMGPRLAPVVTGKKQAKVEKLITKEMRELCELYAKSGRYTKK